MQSADHLMRSPTDGKNIVNRQKRIFAMIAAPAVASAALVLVSAPSASAAINVDFCSAVGLFADDPSFFAKADGNNDGLISGSDMRRVAQQPVPHVIYLNEYSADYLINRDPNAWSYIETRKYEYAPDDLASLTDFQVARTAQCEAVPID